MPPLLRCLVLLYIVTCGTDPLLAEDPAPPAGMKLVYSHDFEDSSLARYQPTDQAAWKILEQNGNRSAALIKRNSDFKPKFRSPFNRTLIRDVQLGTFVMDIRLQSTIPDYGHRDLCLFFGCQDDEHLYYVHFGKQTDDHANQIFIVNNEPRRKISVRTTSGTPWTDGWHRARIERNAQSGEIKVWFDDLKTPVMTAVDTTFAQGRLGFGSFDDIGNFDDIRIYAP